MSSTDLPSSPAAERNKQPILEVLGKWLPPSARVLEIGSGTGQHAVHFARHLQGVTWQASEMPEHIELLSVRLEQEGEGLPAPITLDVAGEDWPDEVFDSVFTANTLHIMPWENTPLLIEQASRCLAERGTLIIYGPFHNGGTHTAESNREFDRMLRSRSASMGVRDAVEVEHLARQHGLVQADDIAMPANNRILVFRRGTGEA